MFSAKVQKNPQVFARVKYYFDLAAINQYFSIMEGLEFVFWLSAILQLILLVCFFILCSNVAKIKGIMTPNGATPPPSTVYSLALAAGAVERAKNALMDIILSDADVQVCIKRKPDLLKNVLEKYSKQMKEVGLEIDTNKAHELKEMF